MHRVVRQSFALLLFLSVAGAPLGLSGQSLRGSNSSLDIQNRMARQHDFTYIADSRQVERFVDGGYLVRVEGDGNFRLDNEVSFPYARPEVRMFVRRLGQQYRAACGETLVVTSLTRPQTRQPRNASDRSVHPTGMAVDLRRSNHSPCRAWLESVLLSLERQGVLEATRERYPPHYHVAIFPEPYADYVARLTADERRAAEESGEAGTRLTGSDTYQVRRGDSLWGIAQSLGVSLLDLRIANGLSSNRIYPGQLLQVPSSEMRMAGGYSYQVQPGDSLWKIARAHETSVRRIRQENGLDSDRIRPGQVLTVPVGE
ncbi:MAG: DUF5715 family protein [Longimicrobiales bacterium]|nr:DUF5715 family protein [Longimicrobiales bacterium]